MLVFGAAIILYGLLGCVTARTKNPCFAIPFGLSACVMSLVMLIFCLIVLGAVKHFGIDQFTERFCYDNSIFSTVSA